MSMYMLEWDFDGGRHSAKYRNVKEMTVSLLILSGQKAAVSNIHISCVWVTRSGAR